uniref:Methyltransferase type 11 domain-containing protein n=1 Tax=Rhizochromulina marina TaxID=1034831 RepID=A0A7S2SRJ9_9STRA
MAALRWLSSHVLVLCVLSGLLSVAFGLLPRHAPGRGVWGTGARAQGPVLGRTWPPPRDHCSGRTTPSSSPLRMGLLDWVNPNYWRLQYSSAEMLTKGVPPGTRKVFDLNGKGADTRMYYYPRSVTEVLVSEVDANLNLLEPTAAKLGLTTTVQSETVVPSNSVDVCILVQALDSESTAGSLVGAAHRMLCPGGRVLFIERESALHLLESQPWEALDFEIEEGFVRGAGIKKQSEASLRVSGKNKAPSAKVRGAARGAKAKGGTKRVPSSRRKKKGETEIKVSEGRDESGGAVV